MSAGVFEGANLFGWVLIVVWLGWALVGALRTRARMRRQHGGREALDALARMHRDRGR